MFAGEGEGFEQVPLDGGESIWFIILGIGIFPSVSAEKGVVDDVAFGFHSGDQIDGRLDPGRRGDEIGPVGFRIV